MAVVTIQKLPKGVPGQRGGCLRPLCIFPWSTGALIEQFLMMTIMTFPHFAISPGISMWLRHQRYYDYGKASIARRGQDSRCFSGRNHQYRIYHISSWDFTLCGALFKHKIDIFMTLFRIAATPFGLMSGGCRVCSARKVRRRLFSQKNERIKENAFRENYGNICLDCSGCSGSKVRREMRIASL